MKNILLIVGLLVSFLEAKTYTLNATFLDYSCGDMCYAHFKTKEKEFFLVDGWERESFWNGNENKKYKVVYSKRKEFFEPAGEEITMEILESAKLIKVAKVWKDGEITSDEYNQLKASLFVSMDNKLKIGVVMPSADCTSYDSQLMEAPIMKFNKKAVKMYAQCLDNNLRMDFPQTNKGMKFLINEFTKKNKVIGSQDSVVFTFSAKGFTRAKREKLIEIQNVNSAI